MKNVQGVELKAGSREELLPGFAPDFPYIATCAELDRYMEPIVPWHWHQTVELFYMDSGCLEYTTPGGKWIFPAGSGGFVNSNVLHTSRVTQTDRANIQLLHLFEPSLIAGEQGSRMERKYVLPLVSDPGIEIIPLDPGDPAQGEILCRIRQAFDLSDGDWGYEFRLREALTGIWLSLFELARPKMESGRDAGRSNEQIKEMMAFIHGRYDQPIRVDELAAAVHISRRACFRLFRENLHMTPVDYINAYRLRMACRMLAKGDAPITEIAGSCGLGSSSYFGKVFRQRYGCTPLEYRRRWHDRDISGQK